MHKYLQALLFLTIGCTSFPVLLADETATKTTATLSEKTVSQEPPISTQAQQKQGKALYQPCTACHGDNAQGNSDLQAPALAAQQAEYLQRQIRNFRSGARGSNEADLLGRRMQPMSQLLESNEQIQILSNYLANLPLTSSPRQGSTKGANLRRGKNLYTASCGACHGPYAEGNSSLNAPRLSHLHADYLRRQFLNFQSGIRGSHADDKYGRQMALMSNTPKEGPDLDSLIAYIQTLADNQ